MGERVAAPGSNPVNKGGNNPGLQPRPQSENAMTTKLTIRILILAVAVAAAVGMFAGKVPALAAIAAMLITNAAGVLYLKWFVEGRQS